jgi:hypothetical protein
MGVDGSTVIPGISIWPKQCLEEGVGFGSIPLQNFSGFRQTRFVKFKRGGDASRRAEVGVSHTCHTSSVTTRLAYKKRAAASGLIWFGSKEKVCGMILQ